MATSSGDHSASGGVGCASGGESACSTPPFVSDPSFSAATGCFFDSAPASPNTADEYGFDFEFDFSSRCPSPAAAAAMSSADELFHNGQIRPMRLASLLLRPQALLPPSLDGDVVHAGNNPPPPQPPSEPADERGGRLRRSRSVRRRYRSLSPFRAARWLSPPSKSVEPAAAGEAAPSASRSSSSSSSSTASSASSSSSRSYRRWGFLKLKDILHRSKSDGGEHPPLPTKRSPSPSPATSRGRGRAARWSSAHARLYEARRAEAEEMRRRTSLPYRRQGLLLLGCLGLGSRGYGAMHGGLAAAKSRP